MTSTTEVVDSKGWRKHSRLIHLAWMIIVSKVVWCTYASDLSTTRPLAGHCRVAAAVTLVAGMQFHLST